MIDYAQAREIALAHIGPEGGLVEQATFEKPYGWYFLGQSKAFLETGDDTKMWIGSSGFIVERENGRIFVFGSAYSVQQWITNYEKGFKYERYDLVILTVRNLSKTIDFLLQLEMTFVVPEFAYGVEWKIPQSYNRSQIATLLRQLPCSFSNQAFWHRVDIFDRLSASGCCTFELREHQPVQRHGV